jgi:hypothetical protein
MKKLIYLLTCTMITLVLFTGCQDHLDVQNNSEFNLDNYFTTFEECRMATAPLYSKVWYDFSSQFYYIFGDGRGNNMFTPYGAGTPFINLTETIETPLLGAAWQSMYIVAIQSQYTLQNLDRALANGVPEEKVNQCKAEARFMRGLAYWYLGSIWGDVPIVEDPKALIKNPVIARSPFEDVLQFAIRDVEYAAQWLPATDEPGRVTKYSAKGMLARLYITAACYARGNNFSSRWPSTAEQYYEMAKNVAGDVIHESGRELLPEYEDLFRVQHNNNSESLFALQFVPGLDEYGVGNRNQEWLAFSTDVIDGLNTYGGSSFISGELIELMHNRGEVKRKRAACFYPGAVYDYLGGHTAQGYWAIYHESDGGAPTTPGNSKLRYPTIKKQVVGGPDDTEGMAISSNSGLAVPMLRLAEVYLLYSEAILGMNSETSDGQALMYFNKVRERAGIDPVSTTINLDSIRNERRCELAFEGQYWYDLVRWAYWDKDAVLTYMGNQHRNEYYYYLHPAEAADGFEWRNILPGQEMNPPHEDRLRLPYPSNELTANPLLSKDAETVPFDFEE